MKKIFLLLFLLIMGIQITVGQPKREVRAVWLTTNYGLDWPRNKYWGTAAQDLMTGMLDQLQEANFNTIIFQVQCLGDVFWDSKIQPWSKMATGKYGQAPKYNICDFVIEECHKRGMEVHAWIVPYRLGTQANADGYDAETSNQKHVVNLHPELCLRGSDDAWYLDPGLPEVRKYLIDLYEEMVTTTNFDGVNLDYTRYPDCTLNDEKTFETYNPDGLSKDDWRRSNVNKFVFELYDMIKKNRPHMKLGAAPIGTYKNLPGKGNLEAYGDVFQDACEWMKQGKHDLLIPQMYWTEDYGYSANMDVWIENAASRQLVIGLAAYKMNDYNKWDHTVITDQIEKAREKGTSGVCFFRTQDITGTEDKYVETKKLYEVLVNDYFKYPAHIPSMEYNGITKPNKPVGLMVSDKGNNTYELTWETPELDEKSTPINYYCVYAQIGNTVDITDVTNTVAYAVKGNSFTYTAPANANYTFAVTTFDNGYYESDAAVSGLDGVSTNEVAALDWKVVDKIFKLKTNKIVTNVNIFALSGQNALSELTNESNIELDLSGLPKGMYVATVIFDDKTATQFKIIL